MRPARSLLPVLLATVALALVACATPGASPMDPTTPNVASLRRANTITVAPVPAPAGYAGEGRFTLNADGTLVPDATPTPDAGVRYRACPALGNCPGVVR